MVIFGDVKLDSSGLHFLNPEYELVTRRHLRRAYRPHRAVLREDRLGDAEHAAQAGALRDRPAAGRSVRHPRRRRYARACSSCRAGRPSRTRISRRTTRPSSELNAFRTPAQRRLIFEEFFLFQIGHAWRRHASGTELKPFVPTVDDRVRAAAAKILPFKLTPGQRQAAKEIVDDMRRPQPMHRLLQGDVGAGKTIVALLAALVAMENGLQVAFMAPTEILAAQHYGNIATAAVAVAVSRRYADRQHAGPEEAHAALAHSSAARRT